MRRCIDCGFLFAVAWPAKSPEAAQFDPDVLRDEEEIKALREWLLWPEERCVDAINLILTRDLSIRIHTINGGPRSWRWGEVFSLRCWRMRFKPNEIDLRGSATAFRDAVFRPAEALQELRRMFEPVLRTIFDEDRTKCSGYLSYEPGLSAEQHSQVLIQTRRARQQQASGIRTLLLSVLLSMLAAFIVSVVAPRIVDYYFPQGLSETILLTPTPQASPTPTTVSLLQSFPAIPDSILMS